MKFNLLRFLAVVLGSLFFASIASANLVIFDDDVPNFTYAPIISGGLKFEGGSTWVWSGQGSGIGADNGTANLIAGFGHILTITKEGGGAFTIDQFDAGLSWYAQAEWFGIWVNSNLIVLGQHFDRFSSGVNFDLTNVTSVTIGIPPEEGYFAIDNIVWHTTVPEPGTLMLVLIGLGFVVVRRAKV